MRNLPEDVTSYSESEVQCLAEHFGLPVGALSDSGKTADNAMMWVTENLHEQRQHI
ncbi:hypothetical protein DPMN_073683 [Dreissena polymorpha]|uniref:Uncharacterized protein n=1 Tax=Dreissena polymorpha TaxID=45954 RepID=A0A9D4BZG7_DREPO|nr:hypothetical protein DPMN_073683 [Dreissena polymorpha]